MIFKLVWIIAIMVTTTGIGLTVPYPLILVPGFTAVLTIILVVSRKLSKTIAFVASLISICVSVLISFIQSVSATAVTNGTSDLINDLPGHASDHVVFLLIAIAEVLFYLLSIFVLQTILPQFRSIDEQEQSVLTSHN